MDQEEVEDTFIEASAALTVLIRSKSPYISADEKVFLEVTRNELRKIRGMVRDRRRDDMQMMQTPSQ